MNQVSRRSLLHSSRAQIALGTKWKMQKRKNQALEPTKLSRTCQVPWLIAQWVFPAQKRSLFSGPSARLPSPNRIRAMGTKRPQEVGYRGKGLQMVLWASLVALVTLSVLANTVCLKTEPNHDRLVGSLAIVLETLHLILKRLGLGITSRSD